MRPSLRLVVAGLIPLFLAAGLGSLTGRTLAGFDGPTSNTGNSFSASSSFPSACTAATPQYLTGWEAGVYNHDPNWSLLSGTAETIDSTVKRNGQYSAKVTKASGSSAAFKKTYSAPLARVEMYSVAIRLETLPAADAILMWAGNSAGTNPLRLWYQASTQKLKLQFGAGGWTPSTMYVTPGTWYTIDLKVDTSADPHIAAWRVDGVGQSSISWAGAAADQLTINLGSDQSADVFTAYYDDFFHYRTVSEYPVGAVGIGGLRPNGMGTHNGVGNFQDDDSTAIDASSYTRVDDVPMNSVADSVKQVTGSGTSYVELSLGDTTETCIKGVMAIVGQHKSGAGGNDMKTSVIDGGTERVVYSGDSGATTLGLKDALISPATSPWSPSAVNGLVARIGYSTDVNPIPVWDAFMLEVAAPYTPPAPATGCTPVNAYRVMGFEHGVMNTNLFSSILGAATIDTAVRRGGAYSVKVAKASGTSSYLAEANETGIKANVISFGFRFASLPTVDAERLMYVATANGGSPLRLGYRKIEQKLYLRWGTAPDQLSSMTITAGTWYSIELRANTATSPRTAEWRIDGVEQTSVSSGEAAGDQTSVVFGSDQTNDVFTANFDDYFRSTTLADYPVGPVSVRPMRPNGMGTHSGVTNFIDEDATAIDATSYKRLDDTYLDQGMDSSIKQSTASGTSYVEMTLEDTTETCIKGMQAIVAGHKTGAPAMNMKTTIVDGATERVVFSGDIGSQSVVQKTVVIQPATAPWSQSTVNGLRARIGYSTDVAPSPIWDALLVEYAVPYAGTAPVGYRETILGDRPVGYWRLGDLYTWHRDETRNSDGASASATLDLPGALPNDPDGSIDLPGNMSHVSFGNVSALNLTSQVSIEAWIKPDTVTGVRRIVNKSGGNVYYLYIQDNKLLFGIRSGGAYVGVDVTGLVTTGEWQHIVGTFNGTTFALYRNGVKAVETTVGSCPCSIDTSTGSLYAGTNDMSGEWFDGGVDEVAVYSSGLTQAQVQAHYDKR